MKNPFSKLTSSNSRKPIPEKERPFRFSVDELTTFKNFLRSVLPITLVNWPRAESRPQFPGLPKYKLIGILEDYEAEDEATSSVHAVFESMVLIPGMGTGNTIGIRSFYGIDQIFISTNEAELVNKYIDYSENIDNKGN